MNRNRVHTAQGLEGVPPLNKKQRQCMDFLDHLLQRSDVMHQMYLEAGDLQLFNNHSVLHSRTGFQDFDQKEQRRLLFRLCLLQRILLCCPKAGKQILVP